ncbi:MAG: ATP-dependent dethiobiotin synthetase BioD [Actinomycetota bacterium]
MVERVIVTGTSTEVGKTWVAAQLTEALRDEGLPVAARKPVQSYPEGSVTDAEVLGVASDESPTSVCPAHRWYPLPIAPPMAAELLGHPPFATEDLIEELHLPADRVCLIEGVGGPRSPVADDGDTVTLAEMVDADLVILVAEPGLGTINSVLLAVAAFGDRPVVTLLNRYDAGEELHRRNRAWLQDVSGIDVVVDIAGLVERITRPDQIVPDPEREEV